MLGCALALLLSADPAAPRQFTLASVTLAPHWLVARTDAPQDEQRFPAPEVGSPYNMYAESGGLQVGPGLRTNAFVYDCEPSRRPQCRVGRADITLPKNLGPLVGLTLHMGKLVLTEMRVRRGLPPPRGGLAKLIAALPIINLSLLDNGGYTNLLFAW